MENKFRIENKSSDIMNVFFEETQIGEFIRDSDGYYSFSQNNSYEDVYKSVNIKIHFIKGLVDTLDKVNKEWENIVDNHDLEKHFTFKL